MRITVKYFIVYTETSGKRGLSLLLHVSVMGPNLSRDHITFKHLLCRLAVAFSRIVLEHQIKNNSTKCEKLLTALRFHFLTLFITSKDFFHIIIVYFSRKTTELWLRLISPQTVQDCQLVQKVFNFSHHNSIDFVFKEHE